jgi:hypothetical protein
MRDDVKGGAGWKEGGDEEETRDTRTERKNEKMGEKE